MPKGIPRDHTIKHHLTHRLKIARGHLDKVIKMVEDGNYCIDVIHQSQAVQSALKAADRTILKNHLETCVSDNIKAGKTQETVAEIIKVFKRSE